MLELKLSLFLSVAPRRAIVLKSNYILLPIKLLGSLSGMDICEEMHTWEEKNTFPQAIRDVKTLLIITALIQAWNTVGFLPLFKGVNNSRVSNIMKCQINVQTETWVKEMSYLPNSVTPSWTCLNNANPFCIRLLLNANNRVPVKKCTIMCPLSFGIL